MFKKWLKVRESTFIALQVSPYVVERDLQAACQEHQSGHVTL